MDDYGGDKAQVVGLCRENLLEHGDLGTSIYLFHLDG